MARNDETSEADPVLLGILALMVAERAEHHPEPVAATELLLDAVGLSHAQIAIVMGKKPDAVRMKIARAKGAAKKTKRKGTN